MLSTGYSLTRFRSRRDAEKALSEILEDGGSLSDYRIDEYADGSCVIVILEGNGAVAGTLGA
jgi:hypothetical protein